jgi:hypothetical protein
MWRKDRKVAPRVVKCATPMQAIEGRGTVVSGVSGEKEEDI